jgi:hypothetical protein
MFAVFALYNSHIYNGSAWTSAWAVCKLAAKLVSEH